MPSLIPVREKIIVNDLSAYPGTFHNTGVQGARQEILALSLSLSPCPLLPPLLGLKCVALCLTFNAVSFFLPLETSLVTTIFKHYTWKAFSSVWNGCLTLTFCVQRKHFIYSNHLLFVNCQEGCGTVGGRFQSGLRHVSVPFPHSLPVFSCLLFTVILFKGTKAHKTSPKGVLVVRGKFSYKM